uniref:Pentatricopeptide repeat-containing protein n=1 Tax=Chenopodium quinoa TaxID=63459 RepID=A0A803KNS4_CHEQI
MTNPPISFLISPLSLLFHSRFYSYRPKHFEFHVIADVDDDPKLFLKFVRQQSKLGFSDVEIPLSHFHHMKSMRPLPSIIDFCLRPNDYSLTILANCYCRLNSVDLGFSVLASIIKLGFQPNIVTFTTLINGFIHSNQFEKAVPLLDKIVKLGFQPTLVTYGSMFKGLCRSGGNAGALKLLRNMESYGHFMPNHEMKVKGISPDVVTYNTLIRAKGLHDVCAYTIMIKGFCKEGLLAKADELLKNMEDNKCFPNECTFNTIRRGFIDGKDVRRALELVSLMRNKEFAADNHTISSFVGLLTDPNIDDAGKELLKKFLVIRKNGRSND